MTRLVVDVMESSDYISRRTCSSYLVCGRWTLDGRFTVICDMSPTRGEVDEIERDISRWPRFEST